MRAVDALTDAVNVYRLVIEIDRLISTGNARDEDEARELLSRLTWRLENEIPVVRAIIAAHRQAAEAVQAAQCTLGGRPAPNLHACNDHGPAPPEPAPIIA
jgi:hypothetical protein